MESMAHLTNAKQEALSTLRELSSQLSIDKEDQQDTEFIHKAFEFIQSILSTLKRMETVERESKWIRPQLHLILSTGRQVAQFVSLQMTFNVVFKVSQEIKSLFNDSVPENLRRHYDKLKGLLAEATEKRRGIQASCDKIMDEVIKACECNSSNSETVRHLDANLLSGTSADIIDCEVIVNNAHEIIEKLQHEAKEELSKLRPDYTTTAAEVWQKGVDCATTAAEVWQKGFSLGTVGVLSKAVGTAVSSYFTPESDEAVGMPCLNIAKKLEDNTSDWEKVKSKRNRYREISIRLGSLKGMIDVNLIEVTSRSRRTWRKRGGCLFAGCIRKNEE